MGGGGGGARNGDEGLFNLTKTIVSVLHKELAHVQELRDHVAVPYGCQRFFFPVVWGGNGARAKPRS